MASRRETLIAENEALFRRVNERHAAAGSAASSYTCECGSLECHEQISMPGDEYRAIRADPRRFFVAPGHDIEDVESVVERHDTHWVVEKPTSVDHVVL